ncbi:hypothetical protein LWI29_024491 [Acer saccharum]|uniref:Peptidase S8/S53 domain-containing protein n=1 Tax=Acer saccharum TaxID=4024 RepID=A0AA39VP86_ACESA|nr:hypothetical protein LWI29_024491 [Acer saccharum]
MDDHSLLNAEDVINSNHELLAQVIGGKIIGARYYYEGYEISFGPLERVGRRFYRSAQDDFSHGSHTASIAAGLPTAIQENLVFQGGAPGARLSVYKVCWFDHCDSADILKAYELR